MANRDPRPGDWAIILPLPYRSDDGDKYVGTTCRVGDPDWSPCAKAMAVVTVIRRLNPASSVAPSWNPDKPFWHVELFDGSRALVHNDTLEPIDPDGDEEEGERERDKGVAA